MGAETVSDQNGVGMPFDRRDSRFEPVAKVRMVPVALAHQHGPVHQVEPMRLPVFRPRALPARKNERRHRVSPFARTAAESPEVLLCRIQGRLGAALALVVV